MKQGSAAWPGLLAFVLVVTTPELSLADSSSALDFPIVVEGQGPYHKLTLPLALYAMTDHADLRDLRIRNAAGQALPFAWTQGDPVVKPVVSKSVPIFPVPANASTAQADALLAFAVNPNGSIVLLKGAATPTPEANQWLLDLSQIRGRLLQARLSVTPETYGLFGFRLEFSDDLKRWRALGGEEQLVRLRHAQNLVERLNVDLTGVQAKFLRLQWTQPRHGARLTRIDIDSVLDDEPAVRLEWSGVLQAERCETDYCDYLLPRGIPAHSLRIQLTQDNTLSPVRVAGLSSTTSEAARAQHVMPNPLYELRHLHRTPARSESPRETPLLNTVAYRLTLPEGQAHTPDLPLNGAVYQRLRLRTNGPVSRLGVTPPTLEVAIKPKTLIFLAQGQAPYRLSVQPAISTDAKDGGGALSLKTLMPGYQSDALAMLNGASLAMPDADSPAPLAGSSNDRPPADSVTSHKLWLWAALLGGLLILSAMAWSLFRSFKNGPASTGR